MSNVIRRVERERLEEMKRLELYEVFLLNMVQRDPSYDANGNQKVQLRQFIDRFQFLIRKQTEFKEQKAAFEMKREARVREQAEALAAIQQNVLIITSEVGKTSSNIERLRKEIQLLDDKLGNEVQSANS